MCCKCIVNPQEFNRKKKKKKCWGLFGCCLGELRGGEATQASYIMDIFPKKISFGV